MPAVQLDPKVLAMLVAEYTYLEPGTNRITIFNIYNRVSGKSLPIIPAHLAAYVSLTNGHGLVELLLRLVDVNEESEPIAEMKGSFDFPDPLHVAELCFHFGGITFHQEGYYTLQLLANGRHLFDRKLEVRLSH